MQRYRVNYGLLIGLLTSAVVIGAVFYVVLQIQLERNADQLLTRADLAEKAGEVRKSAGFLVRYYRQRPAELEPAKRLVKALVAILSLPDVEPSKDYGNAVGFMEAIVRDHDKQAPDVRKDLANLYIIARRWPDALQHVDILINTDPKNEELQGLRMRCLLGGKQDQKALAYASKIVGLNLQRGEFDVESASGPSSVGVYPQLARLVSSIEKDEDLADRIINQMVEVNPESVKALVIRARYQLQREREEEAEADLATALSMAPKDEQVLLSNALYYRNKKNFQEARTLLQTGIEEYPENAGFYRELALVEFQETNRLDVAIGHLDVGLEKAPPGPARSLLFFKASLQADSGDAEGLQKSVRELKGFGGLASHQIDFLEARLLFIRNEWFAAAKMFERVRPIVRTSVEMGGPTHFLLGVCYYRLGQHEIALEMLQIARDIQPANTRAAKLITAIGNILKPTQQPKQDGLSQQVIAELQKPEEEQDWEKIDAAAVAQFEKGDGDPVRLTLLRAEILMRRQRYQQAEALIEQARIESPESQSLARLAIQIIARNPDRGPVEALREFEQSVGPRYPLSVAAKLMKADLLFEIDDEGVTEQVFAIANGIEDWDQSQKILLWKALAGKFKRVGDNESNLRCLSIVTTIDPGDLATLLELFQASLAAKDDAGVQEAQDKILSLVGSENNATWLYTEASRVTSEALANRRDPVMLARANDLVDRALGIRPKWHLLFLARADVALARGDNGVALEALDEAEKLGPMPTPGKIRHITLLMAEQRYKDALRVLENTSRLVRGRVLGQQYAEVLLNVGSISQAVETAKKIADDNPENHKMQLWFSRFMRRVAVVAKDGDQYQSSSIAQSIAALESAVANNPGSAEAWLELITTHVANRDQIAAQDALRRAQLALPADVTSNVLARGYELVGRPFDAEIAYRLMIDRNPDDLRIKRQLAAFYFSARYPRKDGLAKATRLINEILSASADPEVLANARPHVQWARRRAAQQFSTTQDYQSLLKAERLLAANSQEGKLPLEDRLLMAQILALRPEPPSRVKAVQLLEDLKRTQTLTPQIELTLGKLYFQLGDWDACRSQMQEVVASAPKMAAARATYIRMLLRQKDSQSHNEAARELAKLRKIAPTDPETLELIARVFAKFDREDEMRAVLAPLLKQEKTTARTFIKVGLLLAELGDLETAGKIFAKLAEQSPAGRLQNIRFVAQYLDINRGFDLLDEMRSELTATQLATSAVQLVSSNTEKDLEAVQARAQTWLDRGLREDPESVNLLLLQAQLFDTQKNYQGAIDIYRKVLNEDELSGNSKAIVLNNLAYLLALSSQDPQTAEEAMGYTAEAVDILGPSSDILDTRAVVFLAQDKPAEAIADLELALTDKPTASKYFHLSEAHFLSRELKEAVEAWDQAIELGLKRESVATAEKETFDRLKAKVDEIRQPERSP